MSRIGTAFRAFFGSLFNGATAERVAEALRPEMMPKISIEDQKLQGKAGGKPAQSQPQPPPKRSEAVTLLAALQREARFVDLVQEPLGSYSDEQIGAAARSVLRDSGEVLKRFFALRPVRSEAEGEAITIPAGYNPGKIHLTGNVQGEPPFKGSLAHPGWEATTVNLPAWTGTAEAALVVAPAEVEV